MTITPIDNNSMEKEIWKDVPGFEGEFLISNRGAIKRIHSSDRYIKRFGAECTRSLPLNAHGYQSIRLMVNGKAKTCLVHRLVAEVFLPNPENKPEVNHKDFNKTNNHVSNLEWCTHAENLQYSSAAGRRKIHRVVIATNIEDGTVMEFLSSKEAVKGLGTYEQKIVEAYLNNMPCNGYMITMLKDGQLYTVRRRAKFQRRKRTSIKTK